MNMKHISFYTEKVIDGLVKKSDSSPSLAPTGQTRPSPFLRGEISIEGVIARRRKAAEIGMRDIRILLGVSK